MALYTKYDLQFFKKVQSSGNHTHNLQMSRDTFYTKGYDSESSAVPNTIATSLMEWRGLQNATPVWECEAGKNKKRYNILKMDHHLSVAQQ